MPEKGSSKWIITITVIVGSLLELIDTTIVNVSLPQIMGNLGATLSDVSWVVTGYAVANVIVLPMSGWLAGRFGRRNYFLGSIIIFTVASFFCGNADSLLMLVIFRIIQGLAGGGLLSTAQTILIDTWPREEIGMANALFGLGAVLGPAVGPTIGGYITDNYSWPWIFYVNIPVGILAGVFVFVFIKNTKNDNISRRIDWTGIALLALCIGCLQVVLEKGETEDWFETAYISVLTFISLVASIAFIWRELSIDYPIVNLRILRYRSFSAGMLTSFALGFGMYSSVFALPILCQNILGFSAQQTGELMFPGSLVTMFIMPITGTLLKKGFPAQFLATGGMILFFIFTQMLSVSNVFSGPNDFFWPLMVRGVGMAILFVPLTTLAIQDLHGAEIGQGTGLNNMMRQLGGSFGIALSNTILAHRAAFHRVNLVSYMNSYSDAFTERLRMLTNSFIAKGYTPLDAESKAHKALDGIMTKQSMILSYNDIFWLVGFFMLFCIPIIYLQKFKKNVAIPVDAH
ncbi:DHA2 family efflux MFS transporter permease subunit [Cytophagaceae bacterium DM2B3-1]|uniref:DHA2 family efflux MFS transporter permease subunit n=1 Tax=Xanthocytophaga flava TaxID=3048013 RepID=A0AAE3U8J1_9BACT|nr:DHA2 family efflux MFS transporter permease subunit [Xanthocytophaga flavus]MDJ1469615.1 DHA2 family efflux MFS transporter permease subunit [Xanthocytophaga flavus]MDJ1480739.1 DHA2 family efflux MFS transporter permease subunit [Xanthocytophaga flavus]MDJ1493561.1 DHA2 family efflux MFS transporter permease subunit [Xanthocytophaga flavus]